MAVTHTYTGISHLSGYIAVWYNTDIGVLCATVICMVLADMVLADMVLADMVLGSWYWVDGTG